MVHILFLCSLLLLAYFIIRLYLLKKSLKDANKELKEIQADIKQNHILHLPLPQKDLETLMATINDTLHEIRSERTIYAKRERDFQAQIEAISHDLRTPLTVILGYLKLLQKQNASKNSDFTIEQEEMLKIAIRKAEAMEKLIAQFYEYSRLNASNYEMSFDKIDISKVLREVFVDNCLILENANLKVDTNFPNYPIWVRGNRDALERIFANLFQNIGRYAYSYVKLEIVKKDNQIWVAFENDTTKLCQHDIPNLFERFYMKDTSRSQGGTGLGLTIAKSLAEEMGGGLEVNIVNKESLNNDCIAICFTLQLSSFLDSCL